MDAAEQIALDESIRHWEEMLVEDDPEKIIMGSSTCALCRLDDARGTSSCSTCMIFKRTGQDSCSDTPYLSAWKARRDWMKGKPEGQAEWKKAAQVEIDFLKSFRDVA